MAVLSKAQILGAQDLKQERIEIPEWGGEVVVQELSAADAGKFMAMSMGAVNLDTGAVRDAAAMFEMFPWLASRAIVDEQGQRIFTDEDVAALALKNMGPIRRIAEVAMRLSGIEKGAAAAAKKK